MATSPSLSHPSQLSQLPKLVILLTADCEVLPRIILSRGILMPRRRMISPDFFGDSRIEKLNFAERLFFIGIINHSDDEGRIDADPAYLRCVIFPYDDVSLAQIKVMRDRIVETNPNIQLYETAGDASPPRPPS